MKTLSIWVGFLLLSFIITIWLSGHAYAQSNPAKTDSNYNCNSQPLGLFRQVTGASLTVVEGFTETYRVIEESEIKERRQKLSYLDEIDPAYYIYLMRNSYNSGKKSCGATIDVAGEFIAPTGKIFDFKQATYDIPLRKLKFTTVERDGITYDVEAQFYADSQLVKGTYQDGIVKIKASRKDLGIVSMECPFTSWNS